MTERDVYRIPQLHELRAMREAAQKAKAREWLDAIRRQLRQTTEKTANR